MAQGSGIEWTESTWNPVTGCTKVSPGCKNCYAERLAERLQMMGQENYRNGFELTLQPHMLEVPLRWKRPQTIFVNSMSDLFHRDVPLEYIIQVFDVMRRAEWHRFQVLTKRADRLVEIDAHLGWAPNIWMGVSVESDEYRSRIDELRATRAMVKFLSLEPLLGPLPELDLRGIDWVIVGGESGPRARPMEPGRFVQRASNRDRSDAERGRSSLGKRSARPETENPRVGGSIPPLGTICL
jgi:protein gp37